GSLDRADTIAELVQPKRLIVVDESFMDFAYDNESLAERPLAGVVVVRSLTKLWSLAGIRAGYLLAAAEVVAKLEANRQPWSVNALACAALAHCAGDTETSRRVAALVTREREHLHTGLIEHGLTVWPSVANFLLARIPDGAAVHARLLGAGIAVRPGSSFPSLDADYLRIA